MYFNRRQKCFYSKGDLSIGTDFPERSWSLLPWGYLKPDSTPALIFLPIFHSSKLLSTRGEFSTIWCIILSVSSSCSQSFLGVIRASVWIFVPSPWLMTRPVHHKSCSLKKTQNNVTRSAGLPTGILDDHIHKASMGKNILLVWN